MKKSSLPVSARGSALAVTLLFTMVCAMLAFSVLRWSVSERRLNSRAALWLAARNATEGVAEYGFSQVRNDFETKSTPGSYHPGTANALNLPDASIFAGSTVVTSAYSTSNPTGMELIAGPVVQIPSGSGQYYVNPTDLNNQFDPLKGKWVYRQDVVILARSSVTAPKGGNPITHYVTETISVRGAPLFAHAIFYASDLELAPGPQMDIYGPVHTNGSMFLSNQSDANGLNFHDSVTCAGYVFHGWMSSSSAAQGSGGEALGQNPVTFINTANPQAQVNMKASSAATSWKDSTMGASNGISGKANLTALVTPAVSAAFRQYSASTWGGNLLTGASGIMPYNPVAFNQVIDAAGNHPSPYVMIDAPAPPDPSDTYYSAKMEVETYKKSMQAGLYIKVVVHADGTLPDISFYGPANSAPTGTPALQIGPNQGFLLIPPTNCANPPSSATPPLVAYLPYRKKKVVTTGVSGARVITTTVYDGSGNVVVVAGVSGVTASSTGSNGTVYSILTDANTGTFGYGMYDQRRGSSTSGTNLNGDIDLVQIDMRALKSLVTAMSAGTNNANALTYTDPTDHTVKVWNNANAVASGIIPSTQTLGAEKQPWNGAIYIDIQAPNGGTPQQTTSVRLVNGIVANGSSLLPNYGPNGIGLSLSTNAPLYIMGHFNADGVITSTSPAKPDDGQDGSSGHTSKESPVSLAADCITILSTGWSDANSLTLKPDDSGNVEIAAAFLVGLAPTDTISSGGAHNLPRFLENWSGDTVAIRGSLVTMFNCKIGTQTWNTTYYGAPNRTWGFDALFKNGVYPPFTPKVMSYRRVDYSDLTAASYAAKKALLWP